MSTAITVQGIIKEFPVGSQSIRVLHGIDAAIRTGELTDLVGESGSGKTTLISIIAGIMKPTGGGVRVFDTTSTACPTAGSSPSGWRISASSSSSTICSPRLPPRRTPPCP